MDSATLMWGLIALAVLAVSGGLWWRSRRGTNWQPSEQDTAHQPHPQETRLVEEDIAALAAEAARTQAAEETARQQQREADKATALRAQSAAAEASRAAAEAAQLQREADEAVRRQTVEAAAQKAERAAEQAAAREAQRLAAEAAAVEAQRQALLEQAQALEAARLAAVPAPIAAPRRPEETLVMIADDSKVVRVKTSRLLVQRGYRVVLAEDGAIAAELLEVELPAVLITDVEMPGMDGFALTRHVRAHPRAKDIPIIMITSADDRLKDAAAEAGVTLVLGKPYPEDELIACIERSQNTVLA